MFRKIFAVIGSVACLHLLHAFQACPIYLTTALNGKTFQVASLEVNWAPECRHRPQWLGIYSDDPSTSDRQPLMRVENVSDSTSKLLLQLKVGKLRFPKGWNRNDVSVSPRPYPKGKCLSYYVAAFDGNELLSVECLKIYPNWMSQLKNIAQMPLKDLFIPGTHASGAFVTNYGKVKSAFVKDYAVAQHFDVWSQLVFGIRYLDLSIGYRVNSQGGDSFWIVNENMFINPLRAILADVKRFVGLSGEVVILDFSSFPIGFYKHPERHGELYRLLEEQLGGVAFEKSSSNVACYDLTVDDILQTKRNLVILYPTEELPHPESESAILCPTWKRFSSGFMNNSQTLDYMRLLFSKKESSPVKDEGWIFNAIRSLEQSLNSDKLKTSRERASQINPKVSNWLRGPWSMTANVVALDYFSSTNIIDVAIYANLQKAFNMANRNFVNLEIPSK